MQFIFQDPYESLEPENESWRDRWRGPLEVHRTQGGRRNGRGSPIFQRVGLHPQDAKRYPHEFSGGQRQRIALQGPSLHPELIAADELVLLDVSIQARILNLLKDPGTKWA
jgi:ABC-type dipeptide/oligopeptide/nickel transport system ATPase subunit